MSERLDGGERGEHERGGDGRGGDGRGGDGRGGDGRGGDGRSGDGRDRGDTTQDIFIEEAQPEHTAGLVALFEAASSPCYCRFWHFPGSNNEWLARCANAPQENRADFEGALRESRADGRGLVALLKHRDSAGATVDPRGHADTMPAPKVIGWLKAAPAASVQKAYDRRLYRNLPCFEVDRAGVFLVACALIHPGYRRRGVARALVEGAVRIAPTWGARALEALPRRPKEAVCDEELWTGPVGAFTANGFVEVHAFEPYPVLRRDLRP